MASKGSTDWEEGVAGWDKSKSPLRIVFLQGGLGKQVFVSQLLFLKSILFTYLVVLVYSCVNKGFLIFVMYGDL